ncbi:uncharacterized protein MONOS_5081 [Monocercomonoides exilis]|uniref:uncharacterized protein n=1 Tax=Monocercomonoides exilis TaxID=2049356 RepID=UPI003559F3EC|nr:hypothetical protein MONOS_5081 [Monocercomonoides exilis]|eukprot:MONOS_5081.1-p1 / transcript=MONOS_5081.1 / gene=MONOS_5081 / organism=Monocercomonoides_exilis_PA203 / gene_product=unspecified product / transcript_product=unspecified product / location=Mono_scaffold00144:42796-43614(+) / protein_length=207 / sequence_SO=supercontig / SO=protein_coding / is_pseudo=false
MSFSKQESTLNSRYNVLWKEIQRIGGNDVDSLLVYLFYNYRKSSAVINDLLKSLNDLSVVYKHAKLHTQTVILQALTRNASLSELLDYGFDITEGKYYYAKQALTKNQGFLIPAQLPHTPSCKSGINEQDWVKGNNWMLAHSTEASTSLQPAKKKPKKVPVYAQFIEESAWDDIIIAEKRNSNKKQSSSSKKTNQRGDDANVIPFV